MPLKHGYGAYLPNWIISDSVFTKSLTSDNVLPVWRNQTLHIVTVLPGTDYFLCFQLGNAPGCWLFLLAHYIWIYDLYLSYYTRLGWRMLWLPKTERVYHQKLWTPCARIAEVVDHQLEYGQWCGSNDTPVTWWRGLGRGWARMVQLWGVLYFVLQCFFPPRRRRRFCQEVFYGKLMVIVNMFVASLHRVYE